MKKNIEVFTRRQFRAIHKHPDFHMVNRYAQERPHLSDPHEHRILVTVWARCESEHRFVDLLDMQHYLDAALSSMDFGICSFEQMCLWYRGQFPITMPIARIQVEADGIEGAVIEWDTELGISG